MEFQLDGTADQSCSNSLRGDEGSGISLGYDEEIDLD